MKNMKKFFRKNKDILTIIIISILAFIIGGFAINFIASFIIVAVIDILLLVIPKITKSKKSTKSTSSKKEDKKGLKVALLGIFIAGITVLVCSIGFFAYIVIKAPEFDPDKLYNKESTIVYDRNGNEIAKLGSEMREKISFNELPEVLVDAIVATEDSRFFQHNGFDLPRFLKASFGQVLGDSGAGGASTLTMQVVKNQFTSTEARGIEGIIRKFTDIYMSIFQIEKKYTKEEILEFYVNTYYLGDGAYGVEQASLNYFGKSAKDLNLAEAALIAGLFNAPNAYDPYVHPDLAEERRQTVLYLMQRHGYITEEEKEIAKEMSVDKLLKPESTQTRKYKAFIDTVVEEVLDRTGNDPYIVPMQIFTTMDPDKQDIFDEIMSGNTSKYKWENDQVQAGLVLLEVGNGSIAAIGAGRNRQGERTLNFATMIKNQIGSSAKPLYDYGPGIEYKNWSTYQLFTDEPHAYSDGTSFKNWDGKFKGLLTMRDGLADSRNVTAVKAFQANDNSNIKKFVQSLGLSPEVQSNGKILESHALGGYNGESPLTMAAAYAAFSNGGYYIEPYSFTKVIYRDSGEVYEYKYKMTRVMSEETAYMITDMLRTTANGYTGLPSIKGSVDLGAKSGTSNLPDDIIKDYGYPSNAARDLWLVGITPKYSMALWYGYKELNKQYYNYLGSGQHYRIYNAVAPQIFKNNGTFKQPNSVIEVELEFGCLEPCLPSEFTPSNLRITELFKKGTEPTTVSNRFSRLENVTGLNATTSGSKVTLTWSEIKTPDAINTTYLNEYFGKLYQNTGHRESAYQTRLNYNNGSVGTIIYNIYKENTDGTLTFITSTSGSSATFEATSNAQTTYIVKTSYTIFTANASNGASITIKNENVSSLITSEFSDGKTAKTITVGSAFVEPSIIVYEDGIPVTSSDVKINQNGTYNPNTVGTYQVVYEVKYKNYTHKHYFTLTVTAE